MGNFVEVKWKMLTVSSLW